MAGEVVSTGARVRRFAAGDRVMALVGGGAQATLATVDETNALPLPAGVPWPEAGGFPQVFATAHDALFTQGRLTIGERVLVSGAAGGVGTAAVQLAAVAGARVVAQVRDAALRDAVAGLGAGEVIEAAEVTRRRPYDLILELVGGPSLAAALPCLATGGRAVVIGVGAGATLEVDLHLLMSRRAQVRASTLRARSLAQKTGVVAALESAVLPLLAAGRVRVPVAASFPLDRVAAAYQRFAGGGKLGKIVLVT